MWKWLARQQERSADREGSSDHRLALEREAQRLRLELLERDRLVGNLKQQLERQQAQERERTAELLRSQIERLLAASATPVSQLQTQAHRLEVDGKPVAAQDVLASARRLVRLLEDEGLELVGRVDEAVAFDPSRHEPLHGGDLPGEGRAVVVRFVGVSFRGKLLRKAGVVDRGG